jgi:hypothetical protein
MIFMVTPSFMTDYAGVLAAKIFKLITYDFLKKRYLIIKIVYICNVRIPIYFTFVMSILD